MALDSMEVAELDDAMDCTFGSTLGEVVLLGYPYSKTFVANSLRKFTVALAPKFYEDHFYFSGQYFAFDAKRKRIPRNRPAGRVLAFSPAPLVPFGGAWRIPFPLGPPLLRRGHYHDHGGDPSPLGFGA